MKEEGLSIIIPTLNEEKYVGKLLDCLTKQTYKNFEVIVVDGSSDKRTKNLVMGYKGRLNLMWMTSKKRHVSSQRNLGAKEAKYLRLLFLDADSEVGDRFIEESIKNSEIDSIIIPNYIPNSNRLKHHIFFSLINSFFWLLRGIKPCGIGICIFSSRDIHKKIKGFDESFQWTDDMDYVSRAAAYFKYKITKAKVLASVRRFDEQGTRHTMKKWLKAYWFFLNNNTKKTNEIQYFNKHVKTY